MMASPPWRRWRRWRTLLLLLLLLSSSSHANTLPLERAFPIGSGSLRALASRDLARHRLLQQSNGPAIVDFRLEGSSDPYTVGLYYARVRLGNPPKEFYVQIDTGSDVLWVTCNPCNGCPSTSGLPIQLEFFDPQASSTASLISCSDRRCDFGIPTAEAMCTMASNTGRSLCGYTFQYGDGSGSSGYYIQDTLYFETVVANQLTANSSANVIFGCSNLQSGDLTKPDRAVDGIFGFGQHELSVISQLSSLGVAPKVFSHCLRGSGTGGGVLVLGEIVEPGIVYTPLVQSQPHYNINLRSIAVNGHILPIDSTVFETSSNQGTIIDSGTTLAYLAEQAYDPFINAVTSLVSPSIHTYVSKGNRCFDTPNRVEEVFPFVTLNFAGGASMILRPQDYLIQQGSVDNSLSWCIGWQRNQGGITILGDIVLKDKIFVYDLARQRIGWVNYDCSQPVNVSAFSGRSDILNTGQFKFSGSSSRTMITAYGLMTLGAMGLLVHTFTFLVLHL